ncbi:MAG: excinuclease ABC subunit UvrB [Rikenellaceae bacterium]
MDFKLSSEYKPTGDQPQAIDQLVDALERGERYSTLLGVTGSGKTFTVANVVARVNRPTLVLCHNKTLAAQLYSEFKNFFPENAVEYYVSYYDYYQPEAYLPTTGTYIEKDLSINDEIEKMRLSTTATLLSGRRDVIVVSSVSCIYGIGNPEDFKATSINLEVGETIAFKQLLYRLVEALYTRTERELTASTFRVNGETIDVMSAYGGECYRISMFDDEVEMIETIDPDSGARIARLSRVTICPANLFVTTKERIAHALGQIYVDMGAQVAEFEARGRFIEAQRLKQRVEYDLEMIKELGYCSGIENYSRYFDNRKPGVAPFCLLNYFPEDFITVVDESHVTLPQIRGMHGGDRARKDNLVEYGFRLEAARDNRPLSFSEYEDLVGTSIFVSATPGEYEKERCNNKTIEQLIRPTGLIDPPMLLRDSLMPIDDLIAEVQRCVEKHDKVMITTITKRMSEELSKYLDRVGIRNRYIHSDIDTIERVQILDDLRNDLFDVLVGVNLLREGLDLPEVALVAILDADKEGFLRNRRSLIQIAGRAARHASGETLLYGKFCSDSLSDAIITSNRQRMIQIRYNLENHQIPSQAKKSGGGAKSQLLTSRPTEETLSMGSYDFQEEHYVRVAENSAEYSAKPNLSYDEQIAVAKSQMEMAAKSLDFTAAAKFRDKMRELEVARDNSKKGVSYK